MFTDLYLRTTDPRISIYKILKDNAREIALSVIFHTILYASFFNLGSFIFQGKLLSSAVNLRLIISLLLIMSFGYIGRMNHVKEIYHAYREDMEKARSHIDKFFISWVFIG